MDDDIELQIPPEKDLSGTVFSDPAFFRIYPRLAENNVMLYFAASPFFEASNNLNSRTTSALKITYYQLLPAPLLTCHNSDENTIDQRPASCVRLSEVRQ